MAWSPSNVFKTAVSSAVSSRKNAVNNAISNTKATLKGSIDTAIRSGVNDSIDFAVQSIVNATLPTAKSLLIEAGNKLASTFNIPTTFTGAIGLTSSANMDVVKGLPTKLKVGENDVALYPSIATIPLNKSVVNETAQPNKDYRVSLYDPISGRSIYFIVQPQSFAVSGMDANYEEITLAQHPGKIHRYSGSSSKTFSLQCQLVSRDAYEARLNQSYIKTLDGFRMPFYGQGTAEDPMYAKYLGAPPPVLQLSAYGSRNVPTTPVVLSSFSFSYPSEVAYISTALNAADSDDPFPVIVDVSITLLETYSPAQFSAFSYGDYLNGGMVLAVPKQVQPQPTQTTPVATTPGTKPDLSQQMIDEYNYKF